MIKRVCFIATCIVIQNLHKFIVYYFKHGSLMRAMFKAELTYYFVPTANRKKKMHRSIILKQKYMLFPHRKFMNETRK